MRSDAVKTGTAQAPHRSLFNALGYTEEERSLIKMMNINGANIVKYVISKNNTEIDSKYAYEITKYFNERYDGNGYPYGISGEDIPLSSRIIAIADAYDGMVSNRAYRQAMQPEDAVKVLEHLSGKQFDPELVQVFKEILPSLVIEIEEFEKTH